MSNLEQQAAAKWGWFRVYISKNPLTGFWIGVVAGAAVIGAVLHHIF